MMYLAEPPQAGDLDLWHAAISRAFEEYNRPDTNAEEQKAFLQGLDPEMRYALVCALFESEIGNGGIDLVFSVMGLVVPDVIRGLAFFGLPDQAERLGSALICFDLDAYPATHDEVMDLWDACYPENTALFDELDRAFWDLIEDGVLREKVEAYIDGHRDRFFSGGT
jgi:hypothetical protein